MYKNRCLGRLLNQSYMPTGLYIPNSHMYMSPSHLSHLDCSYMLLHLDIRIFHKYHIPHLHRCHLDTIHHSHKEHLRIHKNHRQKQHQHCSYKQCCQYSQIQYKIRIHMNYHRWLLQNHNYMHLHSNIQRK